MTIEEGNNFLNLFYCLLRTPVGFDFKNTFPNPSGFLQGCRNHAQNFSSEHRTDKPSLSPSWTPCCSTLNKSVQPPGLSQPRSYSSAAAVRVWTHTKKAAGDVFSSPVRKNKEGGIRNAPSAFTLRFRHRFGGILKERKCQLALRVSLSYLSLSEMLKSWLLGLWDFLPVSGSNSLKFVTSEGLAEDTFW